MSARLAVTLVATAASGVAWWFGTGLAPQAALAWLAPLPLLLLAPLLRWWLAGLAAFAAGACAGLNQWDYVHGVIGLPAAVALQIVIGAGLAFALKLLLFRRLWLVQRPVSAMLAFAALGVVLEYVNTQLSPHGTFGSLAYSQMDLLPVLQLASVAGIWGITFVVLLAPAAVTLILLPDPQRRRNAQAGALALALVGAAFAYGALRLQQAPAGSARIGLASLAGPTRPDLASPEGQALLQRYLRAIDQMAAQGAQMIVLPETAFAAPAAAIPELAASAARLHVTIVAGVASGGANRALAFTPAAAAPASYAKHHLIPGLESQYQPGVERVILPGTQTGLAVCKDLDFHDTGAGYAALNANLLLAPAWDFGVDGWLHGRMAVMRGVESGFALARAARRGTLTLSDDRGRIIAEADDGRGDAQLVATAPLYQSRTLYARWGDWFAWLALAGLAVLLVSAGFKRRSTS
jgi:apolipoprotein N-acyltransferase